MQLYGVFIQRHEINSHRLTLLQSVYFMLGRE